MYPTGPICVLIGGSGLLVALAVCGMLPAETAAAPAPFPREQRARPQHGEGVEFRMDGVPWKTVFAWLAEQTGKEIITTFMPTGTFTFVGPKGARYTMQQILGIINQALLQQNMLLIDRGRCFALRMADE